MGVALGGEALVFSYGQRAIFDGLTLDFDRGKTVLLGPNGAGKSTLMRLMSGLEAPRAGRFVNASGVMPPRELAARVGYMPQSVRPIPGLTVHDQVSYCGWLRGMSSRRAAQQARLMIERVGLSAELRRNASQLSGGQLRRVGLACALMGDVEVLLLDEPTAGLDPLQVAQFRQILAELDPSLCVVVSTHDVVDLDEIFDRVIVFNDGRVAYVGTTGEFFALAEPRSMRPGESAYRAVLGGIS